MNNRSDVSTQRLRRNGPLWLTISAMLFAVMAVFVRMAGKHGIPGSETTLVRFVFGLMAVVALHSSGVTKVRLRKIPLLASRGIIGGIAIVLYFISLSAAKGPGATSLTNSSFLGNSYFIYTPIFGALLIKERLRVSTVFMVFLALLGLHLIVQPDFSDIRTGDVYGFLAGITSAVAIVIIRELRKTEPAISIFLSLCVFGGLVALLSMAFEKPVWPDAFGWWVLLGMGIVSTLAQLVMTHALKYTRAGEAGVIQMTTVVYSSTAGILWLGDPFNWQILLGALLVLASGVCVSISEASAQ
jgi:drug/metabolite transporter (DMT)-like permease